MPRRNEVAAPSALLSPERTTVNALILPPETGYDEWLGVGKGLERMASGHQWWLGDWLLFGEERFPDRYAQVTDATQVGRGMLYEYVMVCRKFPPARRRAALTFKHHRMLTGYSEEQQERLLDIAEQQHLSTAQFHGALKEMEDRGEEIEHQEAFEAEAGGGEQFIPLDVPVTPEALYTVAEEHLSREEITALAEALGHLAK